ncbi:MAG: alpha-galactosidase [Actinomycetes bacterium]
MTSTTAPQFSHHRSAGVSIVVALVDQLPSGSESSAHPADVVPTVLHWGADLGPLEEADVAALVEARRDWAPHSALDLPTWLGVLPDQARGFTGTPAVEVQREESGAAWAPRLTAWTMTTTDGRTVLRGRDDEAGVATTTTLELTEEGLLLAATELTNSGPTPLTVHAVRTVLPIGSEAIELLDLTGRWTRERSPQRHPFHQGTWQRASRHGRTGHSSTLVLVAGSGGFGFRSGAVWGVHLGWSGDQVLHAERTPEGDAVLGAAELLGPGEVVLAPGTSYLTPTTYASWSAAGLDTMSERYHRWRRRCSPGARSPRPVVVNTWEAVYFDHDLGKLTALADAAAEVGAERFVLDDGWFRGRRDDRRGLGDWTVDREVWPRGLHPLVDHVHGLGMDFGLWVEPEMVNVDSDLAREHPDWILRGRGGLPPEWRFQQVLDLQHPDAYAHVRDALLALLDEYDIAFLKWDHNRDLVDAGHRGRPAVHGQTLALYRLLDELREAHPGVEIESCASGGGRVDLGVLSRTDRIWASDTIDALERQRIQRWTTLLVPPEIMGAHVGGPTSHTTGRTQHLDFRAATALLGHFGIEWDLTRASAQERAELAAWVAVHKQVRALVATGRLVRGEHPDPAVLVTGVVAQDASEAVYVVAAIDSTLTRSPLPVSLPGLDPARRYRLRPLGPRGTGQLLAPSWSWVAEGHLDLPGSVIEAGVRVPRMHPESAWVLHARALV